MDTQSLLILVDYSVTLCYGAVGTYPTAMLSRVIIIPDKSLMSLIFLLMSFINVVNVISNCC